MRLPLACALCAAAALLSARSSSAAPSASPASGSAIVVVVESPASASVSPSQQLVSVQQQQQPVLLARHEGHGMRPYDTHDDEPEPTRTPVSSPSMSKAASPSSVMQQEEHTHGGAAGGHHHDSHAGPALLELNETAILLTHDPDPPSYFELDQTADGHSGVLVAHAALLSLAFFCFLPLTLFLKAGNSQLAVLPQLVFVGSTALGLVLGVAYKSLTPDRYEHNKHGSLGWLVCGAALALAALDLLRVAARLGLSCTTRLFATERLTSRPISLSRFDTAARERPPFAIGEDEDDETGAFLASEPGHRADRHRHHDDDDNDAGDGEGAEMLDSPASDASRSHDWPSSSSRSTSRDPAPAAHGGATTRTAAASRENASARRTDSSHSEETLFDADGARDGDWRHRPTSRIYRKDSADSSGSSSPHEHGEHHSNGIGGGRVAKLARAGAYAQTFLERFLVVMGFAQVLTGMVVYTGACRAQYINGCLAHLIKGSIFLWYGLLTFARYVGAFAEYGWAWNRLPRHRHVRSWRDQMPSAEFVESFVVFLYGATQTWLERLGKGAEWSVKDYQHVSIAVMFWFGGLLGMLLESKRVRAWLSTSAAQASGRSLDRIAEPAAYAFSFNPFPALAVGVTGVAMAAHHQTYQFQVTIHALWGGALALFAVFRFFTYFFLYLRPPASILPARPPTEALAAMALTCGGVLFNFSTEQVTFAAMRRGFDDGMAFVNVTVALVCTAFAWILALFALKGWALQRADRLSKHAASRARHVSLNA